MLWKNCSSQYLTVLTTKNNLKNLALYSQAVKLQSTFLTPKRDESTSANDNEVLFESINRKGIIKLNRPQVLNVCDVSTSNKILNYIQQCRQFNTMIIIKGQGGKAFCAGGDVRLVRESILAGSLEHLKAFKAIYTIGAMVGNLKIPYVALMNGIAMGGGLALGVLGRYRVATENSLCAMPETSIGVYPDAASGYFLPRLRVQGHPGGGNKLGLFLALTGHRLKGADNLIVGLATHMCSNNKLDQLQEELVSLNNTNVPEEIAAILDHYTNSCPEAKIPLSPFLGENLIKIDKLFSGHSVEEIVQNLEKDGSQWSIKVLQILERMSPTSLKLTFKYHEEAANLNLNECLKLDYRLFQRAVQGPDFIEGVRALIIDKDQKPKWSPSKLSDVSDSYIAQFFKPFETTAEELNLKDC